MANKQGKGRNEDDGSLQRARNNAGETEGSNRQVGNRSMSPGKDADSDRQQRTQGGDRKEGGNSH